MGGDSRFVPTAETQSAQRSREIRSQEPEIRIYETEIRSQEPGARNQNKEERRLSRAKYQVAFPPPMAGFGSVRRITGKNGSLTWSRDYYPFGEERSASGTGSKYTYEGKERDEEAELWYNYARFFNHEGRFTEVDPLWTKYPSMSPYTRVANNPLRYVDPYGLDVRFKSLKDAQIAADALNTTLGGADISVEEKEKEHSLFFGLIKWKTKYYRLSSKKSDFNWGQDKYTKALKEVIESEDIIFNLELVDGKTGFPITFYEKAGRTYAHQGGANIKISKTGNKVGDPMGVVIMHELVGHGHPSAPKDPFDINRYYRRKLGMPPREYGIPHPGYKEIIGW